MLIIKLHSNFTQNFLSSKQFCCLPQKCLNYAWCLVVIPPSLFYDFFLFVLCSKHLTATHLIFRHKICLCSFLESNTQLLFPKNGQNMLVFTLTSEMAHKTKIFLLLCLHTFFSYVHFMADVNWSFGKCSRDHSAVKGKLFGEEHQ